MNHDGSFSQDPTDKEALANLDLTKKAYHEEVQADLKNQLIWIASGHLLQDGTIFPSKPKIRYFQAKPVETTALWINGSVRCPRCNVQNTYTKDTPTLIICEGCKKPFDRNYDLEWGR